MGASFVPKDRLGTRESPDYEKMSYCPVIADEFFSEVVAYESNLGLRVPVVKEVSYCMDFLMSASVMSGNWALL